MYTDSLFLNGSFILDNNSLWLSSVVVSSQLNQNDPNDHLKEFKTCFQPLEMLNQIQIKSKDFDLSKDKDVVLILGSTGSGKSTTINYLLQKKMTRKILSYTRFIEDIGEIEIEESQITIEDEDDEFKIGFKKESQTLTLKTKQIQDSNFLICDTPGFQDNRGFDVELSNSICLTNFIQLCRSICPILTINYHDLDSGRGQPFKNLLASFSKFISTDCMNRILIFYTHVPEQISIPQIVNEIIQIKSSLGQNSSPEVKMLISEILKSFNHKRAYILNPLDQQPEIYLKLIEQQYENQQFINDPISKFKINLSEDTETKLQIYSEDLLSYVTKCTQKGFHIELVIDDLNHYLEIKNTLNIQIMNDKYNKCIKRIEDYISLTKKIAFKNLNSSKNLLSEFNERYIKQIKICLQQIEKIDQFKNPHFSTYELSVNHIINELKGVIEEISKKIEINLTNQIESLDIKQLKYDLIKVQQLSKLSPDLQAFDIQIQQFINQKLQSRKNESCLFLEDCLTVNKEYAIFKEKSQQIITAFKFFQEIDSQIQIQLQNIGRDSFYSCFKQKLIDILEQQQEKVQQMINNFKKELEDDKIPSKINLDLIEEGQIFFGIQILQELSSNQFIAQNIVQCRNYHASIKDKIKEQLILMLEYLKENSEKKKYLKESESLIDKLKLILNIDLNIKQQIENDYVKFIQCVQCKIKFIKTQIKYEIKLIKNNENLEAESAQYNKILNKSIQKIKKYCEFLKDVSWIDKKFNTKCVKETQDSIQKSMIKYFEFCVEICEESINNQDLKKVDSFMIYFASLKEIKNLFDNFEEKTNNCIEKFSNQIKEKFQSIRGLINNIFNSKQLPNKSQLKPIDEFLEFKSKVEKMQNKLIDFKFDQEILILFEEYYKNIFSDFYSQFNHQLSFDKLEEIMNKQNGQKDKSFWRDFILLMDFCSKECKQIMNILGLNSFNQIIEQMTNCFDQLLHSYQQTKNEQFYQNQDYLCKISYQYGLLEAFTQYFSNLESLSFMKKKLIKVQSSMQIIQGNVQDLQKAIKQNNFSEVKINIDQLSLLTDQYSKNRLQGFIQQLQQSKKDLIIDSNLIVDQTKNNFFINQQLIENFQNFKEISEILNENFTSDLQDIINHFVKQKSEIIFASLQQYQFQEIYLQFSLIKKFIYHLNNLIPELSFFFIEELENQLRYDIKQQIEKLSSKSPQNLLKLNKKLYQAIKHAEEDNPFTEVFQEQIILNFYLVIHYAQEQLNEISETLQQINQKSILTADVRLNQLEQLCQKLKHQISLSQDILELEMINQFEIDQQELVNLVEENKDLYQQIKKKNSKSSYLRKDNNQDGEIQSYEERLINLKNSNKKQYKKEVEMIEIRLFHLLGDLKDQFLIMNKETREHQVKQIIKQIQYLKYLKKKQYQRIDIILQDLKNMLFAFFQKLEQELTIELFQELIAYQDIKKILNQFPNNKNLFDEQYEASRNNFISFIYDLEQQQKQLKDESDNMQNISKLVEIYEFIEKYKGFINLKAEYLDYLQTDELKFNLTFINKKQIVEAIQKYFLNITNQIQMNISQNNFSSLKKNLQILQSNIQLNQLLEIDLFDFQQELQNIQLEAQNVISLIIRQIQEQKSDQNTFLQINILHEFQGQMQFFEELDISEQLDIIETYLQIHIEHLFFDFIIDSKTQDKEIIFKNIILQFPKLEGIIQNKIYILTQRTIYQMI